MNVFKRKEVNKNHLIPLSMRVSYDQKKDLRELSELTGMNVSSLVRFMLKQYIPRFYEKFGGTDGKDKKDTK